MCVCLDYSDVEFALILTDEDDNDLYEFVERDLVMNTH